LFGLIGLFSSIYLETIMAIQMFDQFQMFTLPAGSVTWVCIPVESHEGFGWSDSTAEVVPENGTKENPSIQPIVGYHPSYGVGNLHSLVEGLVPEPGWKVVGKCGANNGTWVVVPPWYVFAKKETPPPNRWKPALAALAVGALVMWGGIQLLPQQRIAESQTTYQSK
jgi:hypothetical protein